MKKSLALLLTLVMIFSLVACGGDTNTDGGNDTTEAPVEEKVQEVTIGDYYIKFDHAVLYKPYDSEMNPAVLVVYFDFTNNAAEAYLPYTRVYVPATQGGEVLSLTSFADKDNPPEATVYDKTMCEPGQTMKCAVIYSFTEGAGEIEVTFMDNFHTIEDKLVVTINPDDLELITTSLGVAE